MRKLFALAALSLALPASAGGFVPGPGRPIIVPNGEGALETTVGRYSGWPAARVRRTCDPSEVLTVALLEPAATWDDARSACRLLAPPGAWDLPKLADLLELIDGEAFEASLRSPAGEPYYLPVWGYPERSHWAHRSHADDLVALAHRGPDGTGAGLWDVGALETAGRVAARLPKDFGDEVLAGLAQLGKGPVVCVSRRIP